LQLFKGNGRLPNCFCLNFLQPNTCWGLIACCGEKLQSLIQELCLGRAGDVLVTAMDDDCIYAATTDG